MKQQLKHLYIRQTFDSLHPISVSLRTVQIMRLECLLHSCLSRNYKRVSKILHTTPVFTSTGFYTQYSYSESFWKIIVPHLSSCAPSSSRMVTTGIYFSKKYFSCKMLSPQRCLWNKNALPKRTRLSYASY